MTGTSPVMTGIGGSVHQSTRRQPLVNRHVLTSNGRKSGVPSRVVGCSNRSNGPLARHPGGKRSEDAPRAPAGS
jgi:hypothetical protein